MAVYIKADMTGKINNLPNFKNEAMLPVFEAVVNSIQAIEENGNISNGRILITIHRTGQMSLTEEDDTTILRFTIEDNGVGFNELNYDSFCISDSTYKIAKGCKGIGRFFWLKAFDRVEIESVFNDVSGKTCKRIIEFDKFSGVKQRSLEEGVVLPVKTIVSLIGFHEEYRRQPSAYKTTQKIAQRILEHCLSYFIHDAQPQIVVQDSNGEFFNLDAMFDSIRGHITTQEIELQEEKFQISHLKLYETHSKMHNLVLCANKRDVQAFSISNVLGTTAQFDEEDKKFVYSAYISGNYLDQYVNPSRISFDIPEDRLLSPDHSISINDIKNSVLEKTKEFLSEYLNTIGERKKEKIEKYVAEVNPTLRAVAHYCPEILDEIELNTTEDKLEEILYKHKGKAEHKIKDESKKLLKTQYESIDQIRNEYESITKKLSAFQKDQLASYILFRKMIIDLFDKKLELNKDGKHENEEIIHDIIFPRRTTTHLINYDDHNLWIIDERLSFHSFAASDLQLSSTTTSESDERPDIVAFAEIDEDRIARAVSIIEFKKPQRKNYDEDPTKQLYRYLRKINENKVKVPNGRDLLVNETTRFYCYAICDINDKIEEYAVNNNYAELKGERGYYSYNSKLRAHTEIIAFDKIILDTAKRHKAFFERLGI